MANQVTVVGGGYAGCMAANRLQATGAAQVTLINPRPDFVERIRLHQLVAGTGGATTALDEILHPDIVRVVGTVSRIDAAAHTVELQDGSTRQYDRLIYAAGSKSGESSVPGAAEFAHSVAELEDATRLAEALHDVADDASIVIVGGGLTGAEVAAELAEARPRATVTLVCGGRLVPSAGTRGGEAVARRLRRLGVVVRTDDKVAAVYAKQVQLLNGVTLDADVTVWTAGFAVPDVAEVSGLATDSQGRLLVHPTLISVTDPHIIGAGDAAAIVDVDLRMSCQMALPLGAQAAGAVADSLRGTPPAVVNQGYIWQAIGLGKHGAIVKTDREDQPRSWYIGGRAGGFVKEQVCRMTVRWIRDEGRKGGSYSWPKGAKA